MGYSAILLSRLTSMMLMAAVGYVLVRLHVIREEDSKVLTALLVYVLQPCLIFRSLQIDLTPERTVGFAAAVLFATMCMLVAAMAANLLRRPLKLDPVDRATLMFSNVGNLVLPVVALTLGEEMTFYTSAFQLPFNFILWTYGYIMMSGKDKVPLRRILLNPNLIALFAGLASLASGLSVPMVLDTAMQGFHNMVAGTSMLLVGVVVAGSDLKSVFTNCRAYLLSAGRLVAIPLLTILLLYVSGFLAANPQYRTIFMSIMIAAAAPAASSIVQISVMTGRDAAKAGTYNVMSTKISEK